MGSEREALSKTLIRENNPVFVVSVNQLCLICLQLGEKGHSMRVTCKSSVENIDHRKNAVAGKECCVQATYFSSYQKTKFKKRKGKIQFIFTTDNDEFLCVSEFIKSIFPKL